MINLKIYLSPSDQVSNPYAYGGTNEARQCRKIAAACKTALERNGFEVKTNFADGSNAMYERVRESNAWGADVHVCIHTNAGGGRGCVVFVASKSPERMKIRAAGFRRDRRDHAISLGLRYTREAVLRDPQHDRNMHLLRVRVPRFARHRALDSRAHGRYRRGDMPRHMPCRRAKLYRERERKRHDKMGKA